MLGKFSLKMFQVGLIFVLSGEPVLGQAGPLGCQMDEV